jgi:lysine 2,3-aminomutase
MSAHTDEASNPRVGEPTRQASPARPEGHAAPVARPHTLRRAQDLADAGLIPVRQVAALEQVGALYTIAVPPALAALIDPADPDDPIARQVLPDIRELTVRPEERGDPIGDNAYSPVRGVTHRYPDRVLVRPVLSCPMYCRFCFRREVVGRAAGSMTPAELDDAIAYVAAMPSIREVILTGGDPLLLSVRRLDDLLRRLAAIPHVDTLRIHSRVPVADPERIDAGMIAALRHDKPAWLSVHTNHPRELTEAVGRGLARLAEGGVPLLAQTVLLRGVNDDAAVLEALFRRLIVLRVKPYYLHHPDLAPGTSHFRLSLDEGQALYRQLRGRVPGHALPTYVLDIPGGAGKVPVESPWLARGADGSFTVTDPKGGTHRYG